MVSSWQALFFGCNKENVKGNSNGMKHVLLIVIIFLAITGMVFGAPEYPQIINNGTVLINMGVGVGPRLNSEAVFRCPPLGLSLDYALPFATLPFTFGLAFGFSSESISIPVIDDIEVNNFGVAARIAYHFGIPIEGANISRRMDTYLLLTMGGIIQTSELENEGDLWWGFGGGVRYFFLPWLGAYLELGFSNYTIFSGGLSFKL
jgi:hypothetical protein